MVLSWAVVAIQTVINDFKREKREEKKALQDDEYHEKRMESHEVKHMAGGSTLSCQPFLRMVIICKP